MRFILMEASSFSSYGEFDRVGVKLSPLNTFNDMRDSHSIATFSTVLSALMQHDQPATLWPATDLRSSEIPIRDEYIAAIKQGDMRNDGPLMDLHTRFIE